jgi:Tfp pilus assembly protein PilP
VNVVRHANDIQIELSSREAVTPRVTKLTSPERLLIELPATTDAASQNKIAVGSAGVKGVRIGMDGKTPPTTSVVVDLEQAQAYEITPGAATKLVLTLHAPGAAVASAKSVPAPTPVKASAPAAKAQVATAKSVVAAPVPSLKMAVAQAPVAPAKPVKAVSVSSPMSPKPAVVVAAAKPNAPAAKPPVMVAMANASPAKTVVAPKAEIKPAAPANAKVAAPDKPAEKVAEAPKAPKPEEKKWAMNGKRDPFFSPVVQSSTGSGCSSGKKCLEIGQINLRGVVKSETGFIAVVTNSADKAYFLHENDPVFNGYVLKITGDSVVFQETVEDKLGKPLIREVTKKITTPAV